MEYAILMVASAPAVFVVALVTVYGLDRLLGPAPSASSHDAEEIDARETTDEMLFTDLALETTRNVGRFVSHEYGIEMSLDRGTYHIKLKRGPYHWTTYILDNDVEVTARLKQHLEDFECARNTATL